MIPDVEPVKEMGECSVKTPLKVVSAAKALSLTEEEKKDLEESSLVPLAEPTKKRKDIVAVGKEFVVPRKPRLYRAR